MAISDPGTEAKGKGRIQTLEALSFGQRGRVVDIRLPGDLRLRLGELGFIKGAEVTAVRKGPFGDPLWFSLRGVSYALRREDARGIWVEVIE